MNFSLNEAFLYITLEEIRGLPEIFPKARVDIFLPKDNKEIKKIHRSYWNFSRTSINSGDL